MKTARLSTYNPVKSKATRKELVNTLSKYMTSCESVTRPNVSTAIEPISIQYHSYLSGETHNTAYTKQIPKQGQNLLYSIRESGNNKINTSSALIDGSFQFGNYISIVNGKSAVEGN
jgi:hypothetical protein